MVVVKPALTPWLRPAQGFFDLRMFPAAWTALDDLEPSAQAHPETLMLRLEILLAQDKFYEAAAVGADYCRDWPDHGDFFLKTAEALIRLAEHEKAFLLLLGAPESHQRDEEYHYIVATCACRAGRLEEAKTALEKSFYYGTFPQVALADPGFEPLWEAFGRPEEWGSAK